MKDYIEFMPLGGGQNVGASCYYMQLGDSKILLDAGISYENKLQISPDFNKLLYSGRVESLSQISQIYISHAHMDHMGYLLETMLKCNCSDVFMTGLTHSLTKLQLHDKEYLNNRKIDVDQQLIKRTLLENIVKVSYLEKKSFKDYDVTFLQAGHIPGAMMTCFKYKNRNILYTGDCSLAATALTDGCMLPKEKIDVLILCGLHAKHPSYDKDNDKIYETIRNIYLDVLCEKKSVTCVVPQLSKGVEFIRMLCNYGKDICADIYVDENIYEVAKSFERENIRIFDENCKVFSPKNVKYPHIYITSKKKYVDKNIYKLYNVDFTLHDNYSDIKNLIKKINPKKTILVHVASQNQEDYTVEQELLRDPDCDTNFTFAENGELYCL